MRSITNNNRFYIYISIYIYNFILYIFYILYTKNPDFGRIQPVVELAQNNAS